MKAKQTPEDLLQSCLARCAEGIAQRMAYADAATSYQAHDRELNAAVALLGASARLGEALARLRGTTTQKIQVTRDGGTTNEGSNGQTNGKS
ncbi:MAG: hypothetical protein JWN16_2283 [Alphaproteobacteria bacterium]|nr:hypothetical protein [Alphaproteobacteria bacterium]